MTKFVKRTSAPSGTNKYYLKAGKSGYNRAMEINNSTHSCLPNCVGLAHGRWLESQGQTDYNKYDKLPTGNAENYYSYTKDGYERGNTPKVGAIACWRKGKAGDSSDGAGHVAFVEEVYSNGDIYTSNSGYNSTRFYMKKYTKSSNYSNGSAYTFQGFIYNPTNFEEIKVTSTVSKDETKNQLKVLVNKLRVRENHNTTSTIIGYSTKNGIYNYYETYKDNKYTWYRIADNQWIANNGKYLEIYKAKIKGEPKEEPKESEEDEKMIIELQKQIQELTDKNLLLEKQVIDLKEQINEKKEPTYKFTYECLQNGKYQIKLKKNEKLHIE